MVFWASAATAARSYAQPPSLASSKTGSACPATVLPSRDPALRLLLPLPHTEANTPPALWAVLCGFMPSKIWPSVSLSSFGFN